MKSEESGPRVSICIPSYNNVGEVRRLLTSIAQQTYTDFEIILSDDSTNDEIENLMREICLRQGQSVRYVHNEQPLGHIYNWNHALDLARGELIKIMFSDDWFTFPDSLEKLVAMLDAEPSASLAFCGSRQTPLPGADGSAPSRAPWDRCAGEAYIARLRADYRNLFLGNEIGAPSATLYRADPVFCCPADKMTESCCPADKAADGRNRSAASSSAPSEAPPASVSSGISSASAPSESPSHAAPADPVVPPRFDERSTWASDTVLYFDILSRNPRFAATAEPLVSIGIHGEQYTGLFDDRDIRKYRDDRLMYDRFALRESETCRRLMLHRNVEYRQGWQTAKDCGADLPEYLRARLSWFWTNTVLGYWGGLKNKLKNLHGRSAAPREQS